MPRSPYKPCTAFSAVKRGAGSSESPSKKERVKSPFQTTRRGRLCSQRIPTKPACSTRKAQPLCRNTVCSHLRCASICFLPLRNCWGAPGTQMGRKFRFFPTPTCSQLCSYFPLTTTSSASSVPRVFHHQHPTQICVRNSFANNLSETFLSPPSFLKKKNSSKPASLLSLKPLVTI